MARVSETAVMLGISTRSSGVVMTEASRSHEDATSVRLRAAADDESSAGSRNPIEVPFESFDLRT